MCNAPTCLECAKKMCSVCYEKVSERRNEDWTKELTGENTADSLIQTLKQGYISELSRIMAEEQAHHLPKMKKVQIEPWGTLEKFCLALAAQGSGEQNWNNISRVVKSTYEKINRFISDEKRSVEWFSPQQCIAQYASLLKNVVPREKQRLDKGVDYGENTADSLIQTLKQEYISELSRNMAEEQALYLKLFKEREDINSGRLDHKLEDMLDEIEAKEREKEIKIKLQFKLGEKNLEADAAKLKTEELKTLTEVPPPPPTPEPIKTSVTTSPLLTSLLQSPPPLTKPSMPSTTSPTISLLLNSSPAIPSNESPTLTKLLESSTSIGPLPSTSSTSTLPLSLPTTPSSSIKRPSPVKEVIEVKEKLPERLSPHSVTSTPVSATKAPPPPAVSAIKSPEVKIQISEPQPTPPPSLPPSELEHAPSTPETVLEEIVNNVVESEIVIEQEDQSEKRKGVPRRLDVEMDSVDTEEEVIVTVEQIIEKVEEAIIETVGGSSEICEIGLNQTMESETLEDQLDTLELDHDAVELIVMGPNQGPVIAVHHDTSSETNNDDSTKSEDTQEATLVESFNDIKNIISGEGPPNIKEEENINSPEPPVLEKIIESSISEEISVEKEGEKDKEVLPKSEKEPSTSGKEVSFELSEPTIIKEESEIYSIDLESKKDSPESDELNQKDAEQSESKLEATSIEESNDGYSTSEIKSVNSSNDEDKDIMITEDSQPESIKKEGGEEKITFEKVEKTASKTSKPETIPEEMSTGKSTRKSENKIDSSEMPSSSESRGGKESSEMEKRRTGRKRHSLSSLSDSKPNSPSPSTVSNDDDRDYKLWKKSILLVYNRLAAHRFASVFLKPITEAEATGYHSVVLKPIDLTTIKRNIENGTIRTTVEFQRDMLLMVQNAIMYNKHDTPVFKMAQDMLEDMRAQMGVMVQALGDGVLLGGGEAEEKVTRGRSSKSSSDETPKRKRTSGGEEPSSRPAKRKRSDLPT